MEQPTSSIQQKKPEETSKLNENEFKVYDRQLRLWGVEAQKR